MPWFDLLTGGLGQTNPYDEARQWSDATQARNRAAVGLDANGNPLPTDANGNPVTPAAVGDQAVKSAAAGQALASGVMQPQQQPNATKTDPSLGHILMDMTQYQQREQGFNQAMGAGFAAVSQPRDREWVSKIFNVNEPDPTKLMQQEQDLASQQQGQDRTNSLGAMINDPVQGARIADALHMPGSTPAEKIAALQAAYRADPQTIGRMITQTQQPTPQVANLEQISNLQQQYANQSKSPNADKGQLQSLRNQILASVAGTEAAPMIADQLNYFDKHGALPSWHDNLQAYHQYVADQNELSKSTSAAAEIHGKNIGMVTDMSHRIEDVQSDPALKTLLNEPGLKKTWAKNLINDSSLTPINVLAQSLPAGVSFSPDEMRIIDNLRQLKGGQYANALHALGLSRPSEREIEGINSGLGQVSNLDLDYNTYKEQGLGQMNDSVKTMMGNSYGASQNFKDMPEELRTFVDPQYVAGGSRALEDNGSESWADATKMQPDEIKEAQNLLRSGKINPQTGQRWTRRDVDQLVRSEGKRPFGY